MEVPEVAPALEHDEFTDWLAVQHGEQPPSVATTSAAAGVVPGDEVPLGGDVLVFAGLLGRPDDAEAAHRVAALLGTPAGETVRGSSRALKKVGVEVESKRSGIKNFWIRPATYPAGARLLGELGTTPTRKQVVAALGEPPLARKAWVKYVVAGRHVHFAFDQDDRLQLLTLMVSAP